MILVRDAITLQRFLTGIFSHRRQTLGNALKHFNGPNWNPEWKQLFANQGFNLATAARKTWSSRNCCGLRIWHMRMNAADTQL